MRTEASAIILKKDIAPVLMISGGSNFGVRYGDKELLKPAVFSFAAFAHADFVRKSEAAAIKDVLVNEYGLTSPRIFAETLSATTEENAEFSFALLRRTPAFEGVQQVGILTLLYHMERAFPIFYATLKRETIKRKAFAEAGLEADKLTVRPDLNIRPVFAENVLADDNPSNINMICQYYSTPKGGKQYPVDRIRQLLTEGKSLYELMA